MILNEWNLFATKAEIEEKAMASTSRFENLKDDELLLTGLRLPVIFEDALYKNGVEKSPYFSTNCWDYLKYEEYEKYCFTSFDCEYVNPKITFFGIDGVAEIYFNGIKIGSTDNSFLPFSFVLNSAKKRNNLLIVRILSAVKEGKKYPAVVKTLDYNGESMHIRKSPCSYGWDIFPRFTGGGIWKSVELTENVPEIEDVNVISVFSGNNVKLKFEVTLNRQIQDGRLEIIGQCKSDEFFGASNFSGNNAVTVISVCEPLLWNVRGYGEQNLYSVTVNIRYGNETIQKKFNYGIKRIELARTDVADDEGKFEFIVNGEKVFVLGTNWVPSDALIKNDDERTLKALDIALKLNCNAVRCWGGGVYETESFYDFCDKNGILVWQDFMMACATYPMTEDFLSKIKKEAEYQVKRLNKHASVCLFCGDNECDNAWHDWNCLHLDPNDNVITRKILPDTVKKFSDVPYLPSSPYLSPEYIEKSKSKQVCLPEDHLWGARDYFKSPYYARYETRFVSEIGYHGCPCVSSLKKFIKNVYPFFDDRGNPTKEYLCHATSVYDDFSSPYAYRIKLMTEQVKTLFETTFSNAEDFSKASQISQAEALKFFIESARIKRAEKGGIIWWNLLDGWPQISDAVTDYYFKEKLACRYVEISQQPLLLVAEETNDKLRIIGVNDFKTCKIAEYSITNLYTDQTIYRGIAELPCSTATTVCEIDVCKNDKSFYLIKWRTNGKTYKNHFHTNIINVNFKKYLIAMKKAGYEFTEE